MDNQTRLPSGDGMILYMQELKKDNFHRTVFSGILNTKYIEYKV